MATAPVASNLPSQNTVNLRQAFKLALSLVLFYWIALSVNWDVPNYGALAIVLVSLGTRGASLEKGIARVVGTTAGVAIGFFVLGLFNHDRWAMMLVFVCFLTVVGYFMQGSRNSYAWFVAAFVPLVIWGDNYPNFDNAFYFGTFRWLQTTTGIVIYTLVDLVLWPRHAGDQLNTQGQSLWAEAGDMLTSFTPRIQQGHPPDGAFELSAKVAGTLEGAMTSLQQAFLDTPEIDAQKQEWQAWQAGTTAMFNALELGCESITDCRDFDLQRSVSQLAPALLTLEKRIERIGVRWRQRFAPDRKVADQSVAGDDAELLETLELKIDAESVKNLSDSQRAALSCFIAHLKAIDSSSHNVLCSLRRLAGLSTSRLSAGSAPPSLVFHSTPWAQQRLLHALFPAVAFVAAFLFWVFVNPPTGAKVPMIAGIFSLVILRTPMNPVPLLAALVLSTFFAVAPVYWLIMPAIGSGSGLLILVFAFSLLFGYLGGSKPILKSAPLIMFVNMSGISNEQNYSFQGPVDGSLMMVMGVSFVALAYQFFTPLRPERTVMLWVDRFFHGCAHFTAGFAPRGPGDPNQRATRLHYLESMVLPAPAKIQAAQQRLDHKLFPDELSENVKSLHDFMQRISYRMQSLEIAVEQVDSRNFELHQSLAPTLGRLRDMIQDVFRHWAEPQSGFQRERPSDSLEQLSRELQTQLDALRANSKQDQLSEQAWVDLYTVLGSVRGLISAISGTQIAMSQIDWQRLSAARF